MAVLFFFSFFVTPSPQKKTTVFCACESTIPKSSKNQNMCQRAFNLQSLCKLQRILESLTSKSYILSLLMCQMMTVLFKSDFKSSKRRTDWWNTTWPRVAFRGHSTSDRHILSKFTFFIVFHTYFIPNYFLDSDVTFTFKQLKLMLYYTEDNAVEFYDQNWPENMRRMTYISFQNSVTSFDLILALSSA